MCGWVGVDRWVDACVRACAPARLCVWACVCMGGVRGRLCVSVRACELVGGGGGACVRAYVFV